MITPNVKCEHTNIVVYTKKTNQPKILLDSHAAVAAPSDDENRVRTV
jgi:hypothetical protein